MAYSSQRPSNGSAQRSTKLYRFCTLTTSTSRSGSLELFDRDLREADESDQAIRLKILQGSELVLDWNLRIDPMQLEQIDAIDAQARQRAMHRLAQSLGTTVLCPRSGSSARKPDFGRDDEIAGSKDAGPLR
jgi:hypothetical protein